MFCLRILLLLHSSLQARGRPSFLMIISVLSTLVTTSLADVPNKCIVGGTYLKITAAATTIVMPPENGTLTEVGEKRCGFKIAANQKECFSERLVKYIAVDVEDKNAQFCSFFDNYAVCVCPFFGCNSVTGVFYETLLNSVWTEGKVKGEDYAVALTSSFRIRPIDCLLNGVERITTNADQGNGNRAPVQDLMTEKPTVLDTLRNKAAWLFPKQQRVAEMIQKGRAPTTTVATTTTTTATTEGVETTVAIDVKASGVGAVAAGAATNNGKNPSNNGLKKVSLVLNVFLSLTAIAMITFIVGVLVYRKKQTDKKTAAKTPIQEPSKFGFPDPGGASINRSVSSSVAAGTSFQGPSKK